MKLPFDWITVRQVDMPSVTTATSSDTLGGLSLGVDRR